MNRSKNNPCKKQRKKNAATHCAAAPAQNVEGSFNMHMFNTACMLSAAAMRYVADPQHKDAALRVVQNMSHQMAQGMQAYAKMPRPDYARTYECVYKKGSTRLLDMRGRGAPILLVPSLINSWHILDLQADHSFVAYLKMHGFAPYVLDWGAPAMQEKKFDIDAYITRRLKPALRFLTRTHGPVHVVGYCMGGTMAAAALATLKGGVATCARSCTLLTAPWNFHAAGSVLPARIDGFLQAAQGVMDHTGVLPVDWQGAMFSAIDPLFAFHKFQHFATLDKTSRKAARFVAVEDWLSSGAGLAAPAARQALQNWYAQNEPGTNAWQIGKQKVSPANITIPTLVVAASDDRLVPALSASAILSHLPRADTISPKIGHIGMMASDRAIPLVWAPVADWLLQQNDF